MGRKKRVITETVLKEKSVSAKHLKDYKKENKITNDDFAHELGVSVDTLKSYMGGKRFLPEDIAVALENKTGVYRAFWLGKTEFSTLSDYTEELKAKTPERVDELYKMVSNLNSEREAFFRCLNYEYEHLPSASIDFAEFTPTEAMNKIDLSSGKHVIRKIGITNPVDIVFTDSEFKAFLENVKNYICYELYKKAGN